VGKTIDRGGLEVVYLLRVHRGLPTVELEPGVPIFTTRQAAHDAISGGGKVIDVSLPRVRHEGGIST